MGKELEEFIKQGKWKEVDKAYLGGDTANFALIDKENPELEQGYIKVDRSIEYNPNGREINGYNIQTADYTIPADEGGFHVYFYKEEELPRIIKLIRERG